MAVEQERSLRRQHLRDRRFQFGGRIDIAPRNAVGGGDPGEARPLRPVLHPQIGVAPAAVVEAILHLRHHAEVLVVEDHHLDADFLRRDGPELMDVHLETAVAVDVDHGLFRQRQLGAHRGGEPEAHGPEPARSQQLPRAGKPVKLRRPQLVLAHAGDDDGPAAGLAGDFPDDLLRLEFIPFPAAGEGMAFPPLGDLPQPGGAVPANRICVQLRQGRADVGDDLQVGAHVFVDLGVVDVDVNDGRAGGEMRHRPGRAVREADAQRQDQVARVDREIGGARAVHAHVTERQRMILRKAADAHQRGGDRNPVAFGEVAQFGRRAGGNDAAAGDDAGAFRAQNGVANGVGLFPRRSRSGRGAVFAARRGRLPGDFPGQDIFGNIDPHRTGPGRPDAATSNASIRVGASASVSVIR